MISHVPESGLSGHIFLSVVRFSHKKLAVTSARQPPRQNDTVLVFDVDDNLITTITTGKGRAFPKRRSPRLSPAASAAPPPSRLPSVPPRPSR